MIEIIVHYLNLFAENEILGRVVRATYLFILSGAGLALVLWLGTAIVRDLIRDMKGGQWKR